MMGHAYKFLNLTFLLCIDFMILNMLLHAYMESLSNEIIFNNQELISMHFEFYLGHINNLHNTCFWKLVLESGMSPKEAQTKLGVWPL